MLVLSTPDSPEDDATQDHRGRASPPRSTADLLLFFIAPVAVGIVFLAVLLAERADPRGDLQLIAPAAARPGDSVALRAFHFRDSQRPEGPELLSAPGRLELRSDEGVIAEARLEPSAALGLEAVLEVPEDAAGLLQLRAEAPLDHERISRVLTSLRVTEEPAPMQPRGRLAVPLQRYAAFPLRPEGEGPAPAHLMLRVIGGACVPEVRCDLLVLVGQPAAEVTIEPSAMVTPGAPSPAGATAGIVHLPVVTHGPEAEIELVARRAGAVVARRAFRLPVALGSLALRLPGDTPFASALTEAPADLSLGFDGAEQGRPVIVDAFRHGVWARTGSIRAEAVRGEGVDLPFAPLGPGIWRLQARTDPFSSDSAATRMVYVRHGRESPADALTAVAREAGEVQDPLVEAVLALDGDPRAGAAFLFALQETDLVPQPLAMSGQMQAATGLDERRVTLRWVAALALVLAGLLVAVGVLRRGLAAGVQARGILAAAGDETALSDRTRRRMTLGVIAAVLAVVLTFVAAAALILARAGL